MDLAVVLLSDQSIPNALFLKDFYDKWDKILFIETQKTQEKNYSKSILSILNKKENDSIVVDQNDLNDIEGKLEEYFSKNSFDNILVNITGGTKIMALGAYDFFKNPNLNSTIYYKSIDKNFYLILYPQAGQIPSTCKLSIREYMSAVGTKIKSTQKQDSKKSNIAKKLFQAFESDYETVLDITQKFREYRNNESARKKILEEDEAKKAIKDLKNYCGITQEELDQFDFRSKETIDFFTGGWFEYYVFDQIKTLPVDDISCNIKIENDRDVSNELDVVFIINNDLHIIECKTGEVKDYIEDVIYKSGQLRQNFGLSAKSHLVILNPPSSEISQEKKQRANSIGINLIDYKSLKQKNLSEIFREKLKL
ncbi:MAG: Card1-like endonuclease domain-containing protein [Desulfurella sp.]